MTTAIKKASLDSDTHTHAEHAHTHVAKGIKPRTHTWTVKNAGNAVEKN